MNLLSRIKNYFSEDVKETNLDWKEVALDLNQSLIETQEKLQEANQEIADHPKIAVTSAEYRRINENLRYYQSNADKITYINTDGVKKQREATHLPIARTAAKKIASLVFNEQASIKLDDKEANTFIQETLKNDRFFLT
ncbi:Minor capsid protein [Streptococcus pneumoniae]|nr:Minor capsid protein [Streptococcus pneumoniae]